MATIAGHLGNVIDGSTVIGSIDQWSADITMDMGDITAFQDAAKKVQPTIYGTTGSMSGKYNKADAGQGGLFAKLIAGTAITLHLVADEGSGGGDREEYYGSVYLTKISLKAAEAGIEEFSADFTFNGAIAYTSTG